MTGEKRDDKGLVRLDLKWNDPSDLPTLYANHVYVSHAGREFYVIFGEAQQPVLINLTPDELEDIGKVEIEPVAKLVFTPEGMAAIVEAMSENLRKFEEQEE